MAKKKNSENPNFRRESKKQEQRFVTVLSIAAVVLFVLIALFNKGVIGSCSNADAQSVEEAATEENADESISEPVDEE
ncbi:MAG: hypothetical protein MJ104_09055 [Lachnospiraceae bacterium]|nr:hypothetical protein [Lachnospiraceae bacterium]